MSFANNWQWLFGTPILIWLLIYIGQHFSKDGRAMSLPDTTRLAGNLEVAISVFIIAWIIGLLYYLIKSPSILYRELEQKYNTLHIQFNKLTDEYAHALQLKQVNMETICELEKETKQPKFYQGRLVLLFQNTFNKPISYTVKRILLDGIEQTNFLNRGVIIGANTTVQFCTEPRILDMSLLEGKFEAKVEVDVSYGHPDRHIRLLNNIVRVTCYPLSGIVNMLYERNEDNPVDSF